MDTFYKDHIVKDLNTLSFNDFFENINLKIISRTEDTVEFDILNCHPSFANALRRIITSETPTYTFHDLEIYENTSIFPDEYLAQRIGLIPISTKGLEDSDLENLIFSLDVDHSGEIFSDSILYDSDNLCDMNNFVKPGVLICKLAPGQKIHIKMTLKKGIGRTHAKWSPTSLCSYKIMPKITFLEEIKGDDAFELQKLFSPGVIEIKNGIAISANPRIESMSREFLRHEKFRNNVILSREPFHFCFTVESVAEDPILIVKEAIGVLKEKCLKMKEVINELE